MDLAKFIEEDMIEFLDNLSISKDKKVSVAREEEIGVFTFAKDYAKEVKIALKQGHLDEAKHLFFELKKNFDSFPEGSIDKKKAYDIMLEVRDEIQGYLSSDYSGTSETVEDIGIVVPTVGKSKPLKQRPGRKQVIAIEIKKDLQRVDELLKKNEIAEAAVLYKHVKHTFNSVPEIHKELFDDVLATYRKIKNAEQSLQERSTESIPAQAGSDKKPKEIAEEKKEEVIEKEEKPAEPEVDKTTELEKKEPGQEVKKIPIEFLNNVEIVKKLIKHKKARAALSKYKELKKEFSDLNISKDVKEEVFRDLLAIYKSIKDLEKYLVNKKQRPQVTVSLIKKDKKRTLQEKIRIAKLKAYRYLDHNEIRSAMIQYNNLKSLFDHVKNPDEKERLKRELIDLHDRIMSKEKTKLQNSRVGTSAKDCWDKIEEIKKLVNENKEKEAQEKFMDLQHETVGVVDDKERRKLYHALDALRSKLHLAMASKVMHERMVKA